MLVFPSLKPGAYNKRASVIITSDDTKALRYEYFIENTGVGCKSLQFCLVTRLSQEQSFHVNSCPPSQGQWGSSHRQVWPLYPLLSHVAYIFLATLDIASLTLPDLLIPRRMKEAM